MSVDDGWIGVVSVRAIGEQHASMMRCDATRVLYDDEQ